MDEHIQPPDDNATDAGLRVALQAAIPVSPMDLTTLDQLEVDVRTRAVRARRHRHRQMVSAAGAIAAVLVLLVAVAAWPGRASERVSTAPTTPAGTGLGRLLVVTGNGVETWSVSGQRQPRPVGVVSSGTISLPTGGSFCCQELSPAVLAPDGTEALGMLPTVAWNQIVTGHYGIYRVRFPQWNPIRIGTFEGHNADAGAMSPDGNTLALSMGSSVLLVNVATGSITTLTLPGVPPTASTDQADGGPPGIESLAWSGDGHHLALSTVNGIGGQGVEILDTSRPLGTDNPRLVGPAGQSLIAPRAVTPGTPGWMSAVFRGAADEITFWSSCENRTGCRLGPRLITLDLATGRSSSVSVPDLPTGPGSYSSGQLTSDATGRTAYLLVGSTECMACQGGGGGWSLYRLDGTRSLVRLATGNTNIANRDAPTGITWVP